MPWSGSCSSALPGGSVDFRSYGQGEIPLFARAAALLPLALNGGAQIARPSPDIAWTLWAAGFAPHAPFRGGVVLYEDDGVSQAFRDGAALRTNATFELTSAGGGHFQLLVRVGAGTGGYMGQPSARAHAVHVRGWSQRGLAPPTAVVANGVAVPRGGGTPGWGVATAPEGAPQLLLPDGTLEVRVGEVGLGQPLVVAISALAT